MKDKIKLLMDRGYLLDPEVLDSLDNNTFDLINKYLNPINTATLTKEMLLNLKNKNVFCAEKENGFSQIKIVKPYINNSGKVTVSDFVEHYKIRYNTLKKILQSRLELSDAISINRIYNKMEKETVSIIGLVLSKEKTKNNNLILEVEDPTGSIKVLINSNKLELIKKTQDIVLDEVIGIIGNLGNKIIFANDIFYPDSPLNGNNLKKSLSEEYIAFISDIHVGSRMFLEKEFLKFIKWINAEAGTSEQKEIAKKIKYLVIAGDVVDGVGIYPGQYGELIIYDLKSQFDKFVEFLSMFRKDISIIISPGNHDAIRLAEPQPMFDRRYANKLYELENVYLVMNPSVVRIGESLDFPGFDILIYHGFSFDYYIDQVESIRFGGGYDRGDLVMKFLLQKRHLAPSHTSTLFIPDPKMDNLLIEEIPDFFVSGHIHKSSISQFGKTTMICGSCWQSRTLFQDKVGHHPEPCRVPIINLKTRDVKLMKFCD